MRSQAVILLILIGLMLSQTACTKTDTEALEEEIAIAVALTQTEAARVLLPSPTVPPTEPPTTAPTSTVALSPTTAEATATSTTTPLSSDLGLGPPTFQDNFNKPPSYLYLGSDGQIVFEAKEGNLIMSTLGATGDRWRIAELSYLSNFYLQIITRNGEKCSGKDAFGIIVRSPEPASGYVSGISCDGSYRLYRIQSGQYRPIREWTPHPLINAGPNQTNTLGMMAVGDSLKVYLNGQMIDQVTDNNYLQGYFGLMIRSDSTVGFSVLVDQLSYWELTGPSPLLTTPVAGQYQPLPNQEIIALENSLVSQLKLSFKGGKAPFYDPFSGQLLGNGNLLQYTSSGVYGPKHWQDFSEVFTIFEGLGWQEDAAYSASAPYHEIMGFRKDGNKLAFVKLTLDLAQGVTCPADVPIDECYKKLNEDDLVYNLVINTALTP